MQGMDMMLWTLLKNLTDRIGGKLKMLKENNSGNIAFLKIMTLLKKMKETDTISSEEYEKAKIFYRDVTGADIVVCC